MHLRPRWLLLAALGALVMGCGDGLDPDPSEQPVRVILVHRQDIGRNVFVRTDGTPAGMLEVGDSGLLPVGASRDGTTIALLVQSGSPLLAVTTRERPDRLDTIIDPLPASHSLASVSDDGRLVAVVSPNDSALLLFDRANHSLDTVAYRAAFPVLPPVISPDNSRVGLITGTGLSLFFTVLFPDDPSRIETNQIRLSPVLNRPIWGWPRWTDEGVFLAAVRVALDGSAPDTLVGVFNPERPGDFFDERFRAVMAPVSNDRSALRITPVSTYAFSPDGRAIVLGAAPDPDANRHAIYLITPEVDRVQLVVDDPSQFPVFPLFVQ